MSSEPIIMLPIDYNIVGKYIRQYWQPSVLKSHSLYCLLICKKYGLVLYYGPIIASKNIISMTDIFE